MFRAQEALASIRAVLAIFTKMPLSERCSAAT